MSAETPGQFETEPNSTTYITASRADIAGILDVQNPNLLSPEAMSGDAGSQGFLVHPLSGSELEEILEATEQTCLIVAKENGTVVGYVLGYDLAYWKSQNPDWSKGLQLREDADNLLNDKSAMYARHIGTDQASREKGVGSQLFTNLLEAFRRRGCNACTLEVLDKPITNQRSADFVESRGFTQIGENVEGDGMVWRVYYNNI